MKINPKIKAILIVLTIVALLVTSVIAVSYVLQTSPPVNATVESGTVQVPVTLTLNATTLSDLDKLQLTATTGANGNGLNVIFRDGAVIVGSGIISSGFVSIVIGPLGIGVHTFTAGP